ncbi:MAG: VIT domain-containing protein [Anaerolineae bacterium]
MKKISWLVLVISLFVGLLVGSRAVHAQTPDPLPPIPIPPEWNFEGLRIEYQRVDVTIEEQVATTHIEQLFVNDNEWMLEGTYLFPLPEGAAVSQLTMWVDGQPIEAKVLPKEEARAIYDEIVRQLRDPALLEYVGTQAIQANVFPIPGHDERRIEIEYSQVLPADNGLIHYVYPQSTDLYTNTPLDEQRIRVEVRSNEAIRTIYSPSHPVAIDRDGEFRAVVGFEDADVLAETDFEMYYSVSPEQIGLNLLSYKEPGEDGFFLLLAAPSVQVDEVVAKDVILVVDTSGSMEGEKMMQAKEAALYVVEHLNPQDRFNIVAFSTGVRTFANGLARADDAGNYRSFVNSLEAVGGTNISQALLEAAAMADGERPSTIIFLTDGLATEGITDTGLLLDSVKTAVPANVRLFAFGVGNDVDTLLLDSLAQNHRGATSYVRPFEQIDEEVSGFYAKVSAPVLANISLDFGDVVVEQMYPQTLPDLFAGSQLVLAGRYREGMAATIRLTGEVNGRTQTFTYADNLFRSSGGDDFIPRLWATRAIGHLLTQIRLHDDNPELVQSIVNLSVRYGIITPYTSYLIEEDDILSQSARDGVMEEAESMFAAPAEVSGESAVDRADMEGNMAAAEAPLPMPTMPASPNAGGITSETSISSAPVQYVGSKTFILRDGVWLDTQYNPDTDTPQAVGFASDGYFDLLTAVPELGDYFSLGQRVVVVYGDQVYEIVEGEGISEIALPATISEPDSADGSDNPAPVLITGEEPDAEPEPVTFDPLPESGGISPVWIFGILAVIVVGSVLLAGRLLTKRG